MSKQYCQVGTPVQFFKWDSGGWVLWPAVIYTVKRGKVNILLLTEFPSVERLVRHADFKQKGKDYWQHIPQQSPE